MGYKAKLDLSKKDNVYQEDLAEAYDGIIEELKKLPGTPNTGVPAIWTNTYKHIVEAIQEKHKKEFKSGARSNKLVDVYEVEKVADEKENADVSSAVSGVILRSTNGETVAERQKRAKASLAERVLR